jgi:hypothetical protein
MRRPVSGRDAVRSQVIDVLKAQIKRRPAMKKVSIAAAKASRNIFQPKLTIGLDLGDRNSFYCADGSMATAANGREEKRVEQHEPRIPLTPTGLLMEGHFTQNPPGRHFECNRDISTATAFPNRHESQQRLA